MRVSLQKSIKVNMGNYEHVEVSAHITLGEDDFDEEELAGLDRDGRMELLQREAKQYMNDYLAPELSVLAATTKAVDTMLDPPAPPRRERATRSKRSKD